MRESRAAHPSMDVYCFGQMVSKLLRQRERTSSEASAHSEDSWHERTACRVLQEAAHQCTRRDPTERPSAWKLLLRLQRHCGEEPVRCDSHRERVALSTAPQPPLQLAPGPSEPTRRKRSRGSDEQSRSVGGCKQRSRSRSRSHSL